jgi:DNA excision repair protein ERCC-5
VTEDSDAFLFGAHHVYKNMISDKKFVEVFAAEDAAHLLGLRRADFVQLALLLGSDYTTGIKGIGSVNALEVIRAFPGVEGLREFKDWVQGAARDDILAAQAKHQKQTRKASSPKKRVVQPTDDDAADPEEPEEPGEGDAAPPGLSAAQQKFVKSHRESRRNWLVPDDFPSPQVVGAYMSPRVLGVEELQLESPDVEGLKAFCKDRLGWCVGGRQSC